MVPPRWLYRLGWSMHNLVDRLSGGRLGTARPRGTRVGVLFLTTTGARSGATRRNALNYLEDGRNLLVIASNAGAPGNPGWKPPRAAFRATKCPERTALGLDAIAAAGRPFGTTKA